MDDICGEKKFEFDAAVPPFLSVTYNSVPTGNPFTIEYDQALATTADIGVTYTIDYTVTIVDYTGLATVLSDQLTFQIACPDLVSSSTLDTQIVSFVEYDVASGAIASLDFP